MRYHRTKVLILALFCLFAVSTLLTTTANIVAKGEEQEETHVVVGEFDYVYMLTWIDFMYVNLANMQICHMFFLQTLRRV